MRRLLLLLLPVIACAPHRSEIRRLNSSHPPQVIVGHYPDYVRIIYGPNRLQPVIDRLRSDVEANEPILRRIVREHLELKSPLEFSFKYAATDSSTAILLLRYFAPHPNPVLIAGWQVQLLYRLPSAALERVFVEEVPLE